ncbi:hypothetical protein BJX64DRAFT_256715 [Aspergillus heterothallicus]
MLFGTDIASYNLQLDKSSVFLPAHRDQGSSKSVTGHFQLSLARPTLFKGIKARVIGRLKTPRYGIFMPETHEETTTYERTQHLAFSKSLDVFTLPAGSYEFPLDLPLDKIPIETLTGPGHAYHTYTVEVVLQRRMARDITVSRPLRIYRYPSSDILEMWEKPCPEEKDNEDIRLSISIPDTLVQHGSTIPVDVWMEKLSESISISRITVQVHEKHDLCLTATAAETTRYQTHFITWHRDHIVFKEECSAPQLKRVQPDRTNIQQMTIPVQLPRGLNVCSQTFTSRSIKIKHLLVVEVHYQNQTADAPTKITRTLPLYIYMAPIRGETCGSHTTRKCLEQKDGRDCPPSYGTHTVDQLISWHTVTGDDLHL